MTRLEGVEGTALFYGWVVDSAIRVGQIMPSPLARIRAHHRLAVLIAFEACQKAGVSITKAAQVLTTEIRSGFVVILQQIWPISVRSSAFRATLAYSGER
jgi:hypothetical protein